MPQISRELVIARRHAIALVIASSGWSQAVKLRLMRDWRLSNAQIYREKRAIISELADLESGVPIEEKRAEILVMIRGVISDSRKDGKHRTALQGIKLLSEVCGILNTPPPVVIAIDGRQLAGEKALLQLEERIESAGFSRGPVIDLNDGDL